MVGGGTVNKSRASFQEEWFASRYDQRLKDIATKYPHLASVVKADRSPILDHAEAAQRAEQKSAEMADRIGMVDVRESVPALKKVPILPDVANLTANIATNPTATVAQFWGGFKAQMQDPVEAAMNLAGFGAGRASMSVLKTAMLNAAANAAVEAVANPLRQYNRKEMGLDYGWERFFSDVSGAAATGALLDAGVRGPYRAVITRFGRDVPEGQMFSKQGRGGLLTDAIPQMDPIKPVVREKITPEEYEKARTGDIDAISQLTQAAQALLQEGRGFFGAGVEFTQLEAFVRSILEPFAAQANAESLPNALNALTTVLDRLTAWLNGQGATGPNLTIAAASAVAAPAGLALAVQSSGGGDTAVAELVELRGEVRSLRDKFEDAAQIVARAITLAAKNQPR